MCGPDAEFPFGSVTSEPLAEKEKREIKRSGRKEGEKRRERGAIAQTNNKTNLQKSPSI